MARKGSHKVKTGCFTCKKRKVKCDETKPHCLRCTSTARKCDGYSPPAPGSYSWSELLGRRSIVPAITARRNTKDGRALEFYHQVVAPAFSHFPGDEFWTRMVAQASLQEPVVRHAVVAISSMYELMDAEEAEGDLLATQKGRYALLQYNQSLQQLAQTREESIVLFVCILFICIEALRGNKQAALTHCRHGMQVFNHSFAEGSSWACDYFRPIFVRLTACPFFFGATSTSISAPLGSETEDISGPPNGYDVCRYRIDLLVARCIRFVREFEAPTPGYQRLDPDYTRFQERQSRLLADMRQWNSNYKAFEATHPRHPGSPAPYLLMEMMAIVCTVWVSTCTAETEMVYDDYQDSFQKIIDLAEEIAVAERQQPEQSLNCKPKPKFVLEMAFIPVLFFVVIKCRILRIRLAALNYLATISAGRENLWEKSLMHAVGRRFVEIEHGISLGDPIPVSQSLPDLPPDCRRLRSAVEVAENLQKGVESEPLSPDCFGSEAPPSQRRVREALVLKGIMEETPGMPSGSDTNVSLSVGHAANPIVKNVPLETQYSGTSLRSGSRKLMAPSLP